MFKTNSSKSEKVQNTKPVMFRDIEPEFAERASMCEESSNSSNSIFVNRPLGFDRRSEN